MFGHEPIPAEEGTASADRRSFKTQVEGRMAIFEFIEGFYNPRRRHSLIGYLSPITFER
jgi:putative transposase